MPSAERLPSTRKVFLLDQGVLTNQLLRDASILGEHEQPSRVDVKSAGRGEPTQVSLLELYGQRIRRPAILRADQDDGGFVAVFGLAGDIAHRLVQQDGDLSALVFTCGQVDLDVCVG
jgi:hypothetical protein